MGSLSHSPGDKEMQHFVSQIEACLWFYFDSRKAQICVFPKTIQTHFVPGNDGTDFCNILDSIFPEASMNQWYFHISGYTNG
jgi:hypothetical protein